MDIASYHETLTDFEEGQITALGGIESQRKIGHNLGIPQTQSIIK